MTLNVSEGQLEQARPKDLFDLFQSVFSSRHGYATRWKEQTGGPVAGYLCTYVPEEVLYAAGALPVRIFGSHEPQDITDSHIFYATWCPFCRDCLAQALQGRYDYLDGLVIASTCRHLDQTFVSWRRHHSPHFTYNLYVPGHLQSTFAQECLAGEIKVFQAAVERWRQQPVSAGALESAIEVYNTNRRLLRELYQLRKGAEPALSGAQAMQVVLASQVMDKAEHSRLLTALLKKLEPTGERVGVRLMLLGSECDDLELVRLIESSGAIVVTDEHCTGSRYFWNETPQGDDLISRLAARYTQRPPCPHKDLVDRRRHEFVKALALEYEVQGAIFIHQRNCDIHNLDSPTLIEMLRDMGIPSLLLEVDVTTPIGQFRTRLEAYMEVLAEGEMA